MAENKSEFQHIRSEEQGQGQGQGQKHDHDQEQEEEQRGLLAPVLDPIGSVLGTTLRPIGATVGMVTKPVAHTVGYITKPAVGPLFGDKREKMEVLGGENVDSYKHKKESIGGKVQSGDNPLGLDQTGRWGFMDEQQDE